MVCAAGYLGTLRRKTYISLGCGERLLAGGPLKLNPGISGVVSQAWWWWEQSGRYKNWSGDQVEGGEIRSGKKTECISNHSKSTY